jgi:hypothetical protein
MQLKFSFFLLSFAEAWYETYHTTAEIKDFFQDLVLNNGVAEFVEDGDSPDMFAISIGAKGQGEV